MSGLLNRSTSEMNGGGDVCVGAMGLRDSLVGIMGSRHLREAPTASPLQIFVRAKKKINDIYQEIEEYVAETTNFLEGKYLCYFSYIKN